MNIHRYRNSPQTWIEQFFEGSGIEVEDYEPGSFLTLVFTQTDGREAELNIMRDKQTGSLKIWREIRE